MSDDLKNGGAVASFIISVASFSMALLAALALVGISGVTSGVELVYRLALAIVATVVAGILLRNGVALKEARRAAELKPAPVRIRTRERLRRRG